MSSIDNYKRFEGRTIDTVEAKIRDYEVGELVIRFDNGQLAWIEAVSIEGEPAFLEITLDG